MSKRYIYYVATFNTWVLVPADNAEEALMLGMCNDIILFSGGSILTVRIATSSEISQHNSHERFMAKEEGRTPNLFSIGE